MKTPLTIALPKGRIGKPLARFLAGPPLSIGPFTGRGLVVDVEEKGLRFLLLKDGDVPTYVRRGAAEMGIAGSDVLAETECDLPRPLEFPFGRCRFSLLAPSSAFARASSSAKASEDATADTSAGYPSAFAKATADTFPNGRAVRVATKYVRLTRDFFDQKGMAADIVPLSGSVEIAPRMKLADMVADLVDTGETMRANGLVEVEKICDVSPHLVVSRAALARRRREVFDLLEVFERMLAS